MGRWTALLVCCAATFFFGLDRQAITDSDEAYYTEAGRVMSAEGDWITPHFNGEPRLQKPILFYWLIAGTNLVTGGGEVSARLWAALSGVGLAVAAVFISRRWLGPGADIIAGAIVATSFGVTMIARQSLPDVPLALCVTVTIWAAIEALAPAPGGGRRGRWLIASAVAAALGLLTKGPIALVIPAIVVAPAVVWEHGGLRAAWTGLPVRASEVAWAAAAFVIVAAPWYAAVTIAQGPGYLAGFFVGENLERFATDRFNEPRSIGFYIPILAGGMLPWSPAFLLWIGPIARLIRRARAITAAEGRLAIWFVIPFALLSVSVGKQPRYLLPCLVPVAILLAHGICRRIEHAPAGGRDGALSTVGALSGLIIAAIGLLILRLRPILAAVDPDWSPTAAFVVVAAGAVVMIAVWFVPAARVPWAIAAGAVVAGLGAQASIFWLGRPEPVEIIGARIRAEGPLAAVCACGAFARSLPYYTHGTTTMGVSVDEMVQFLGRPERVLAAIDAEALRQVELRTGRAFPRLADVTYLNTAALRVGSLIDPDPARHVQRVVLVSNQ